MKNLTRRDLFKLAGAATASALLAPHAIGKARDAGSALTYGLFFGDEALEEMRRLFNSDPRFAKLRAKLTQYDFEKEHRYLSEEVRYNDHIAALRRIGPLAEDMAFLYLMTGSPEAEKLTKEIIRTIMRFERWDFYMDGGVPIGVQSASSCIIAVSLASDWLGGDRVSAQERSEWIATMGQRGCEPCYRTLVYSNNKV